jgi:hypothetical protein
MIIIKSVLRNNRTGMPAIHSTAIRIHMVLFDEVARDSGSRTKTGNASSGFRIVFINLVVHYYAKGKRVPDRPPLAIPPHYLR